MCELLFNTSLHLFPNKWLRDPSIELDHPLKNIYYDACYIV